MTTLIFLLIKCEFLWLQLMDIWSTGVTGPRALKHVVPDLRRGRVRAYLLFMVAPHAV